MVLVAVLATASSSAKADDPDLAHLDAEFVGKKFTTRIPVGIDYVYRYESQYQYQQFNGQFMRREVETRFSPEGIQYVAVGMHFPVINGGLQLLNTEEEVIKPDAMIPPLACILLGNGSWSPFPCINKSLAMPPGAEVEIHKWHWTRDGIRLEVRGGYGSPTITFVFGKGFRGSMTRESVLSVISSALVLEDFERLQRASLEYRVLKDRLDVVRTAYSSAGDSERLRAAEELLQQLAAVTQKRLEVERLSPVHANPESAQFKKEAEALEPILSQLRLNREPRLKAPMPMPGSTTGSSDNLGQAGVGRRDDPTPPYVRLVTDVGEITIRLDLREAPAHSRYFLRLASSGYYDGTTFFRVNKGQRIIGGDPNVTPGAGSGLKDGESAIMGDEVNELHHQRGTVSLARGPDRNSTTSQFFICLDQASVLDGKYTVFGEVTDGWDAVTAIARGLEEAPDGSPNAVTIRRAFSVSRASSNVAAPPSSSLPKATPDSPEHRGLEPPPFLASGTWRGSVRQFLAKPYSVVITLRNGEVGTVVGTIDYPELKCGGSLRLIETASERVQLGEELLYGSNVCVGSGTIVLADFRGRAAEWSWYEKGFVRRATAHVMRAGADAEVQNTKIVTAQHDSVAPSQFSAVAVTEGEKQDAWIKPYDSLCSIEFAPVTSTSSGRYRTEVTGPGSASFEERITVTALRHEAFEYLTEIISSSIPALKGKKTSHKQRCDEKGILPPDGPAGQLASGYELLARLDAPTQWTGSGFSEGRPAQQSCYSAAKRETVVVSGGTFDTLRVSCTVSIEASADGKNGAMRGSMTLFVASGVGLVKREFLLTSPMKMGGSERDVEMRVTTELVSRKP